MTKFKRLDYAKPPPGQLVDLFFVGRVNWSTSRPVPKYHQRSTGPRLPVRPSPQSRSRVNWSTSPSPTPTFVAREISPSPYPGSTGPRVEPAALGDPFSEQTRSRSHPRPPSPRRGPLLSRPPGSPPPWRPPYRTSSAPPSPGPYLERWPPAPTRPQMGRTDHWRAYTQQLVRTSLLDCVHDPVVHLGRLQRFQSPPVAK